MKIMTILHSHCCGGAEKQALAMMVGLKSQEHQVSFAGPADSWLAESAAEKGIGCFGVALTGYFDLLSLVRLCRAIRLFGADVLHGHLAWGAYYAGLAARLTGKFSVATAHFVNSHKPFQLAKRVIAVSESVRNELIEHQCRPERITVIRHGIESEPPDPAARPRVRRALALGDRDIALCMVSRLAYFDGHDLVLDAMVRLADPHLHLFLVGETPGAVWYDALRDWVRDLGLAGQVHVLGHREEVGQFLSAMDIFVSPSQREAFPTAVLEACASGVPVIASRGGGTGEIIRQREHGLLFESGNCRELAALIAELAADPELRSRLAREARENVLQRFSLDQMIDSTLRLYRSELDR